MIKKVYIDTSVVGGQYDPEFEFWTKMFFKAVVNGEYQIIISELLIEELQLAPNHIRNSLDNVPKEQKVFVELSNEAYNLANLYIKNNIVGKKSISDCRYIATATVNEIEILTSWNFKHIVSPLQWGEYPKWIQAIEIRTPRELLDYGD